MLEAAYFDGHSSRRRRVQLQAEGAGLRLRGEGVERWEPLATMTVGERLGSAPRLLRLADGAYVEVADAPALEALLAAAGHRATPIERAQQSWSLAIAAVLLSVLALAAAYVWGLPALAREIAERLPQELVTELSEQTLQILEGRLLRPSSLPPQRQQALLSQFEAMAANLQRPRPRLLFRAAPRMGPNALALPDGRIVLLDELVTLADRDQQLLAVLAHELGHVQHHHGLRLLVQGTVTGALAAWWLGDVSELLAVLPTVLLTARHSRAFEREADRTAVALLGRHGIAPSMLADMLEKLEAVHRRPQQPGDWSEYFSSHPSSPERIRALREGPPAP